MILLPYTPNTRPAEQERARQALAIVIRQENIRPTDVVAAICRPGEPFAYYNWLRTAWEAARARTEPLWVIEHDVVLTARAYRAKSDCPEPFCAAAYQIPPTRWGVSEPVWVHRVNQGPWHTGPISHGVLKASFPDDPPVTMHRRIRPGEQWADYAGLGCVRMRPDRPWPLPEPVPWKFLDTALSEALRVRWSIHWPALAHG